MINKMSYTKENTTRSPTRRDGLSFEELRYVRSTIELIEHQLDELKTFLAPMCRKKLFVSGYHLSDKIYFLQLQLFFLFQSSKFIQRNTDIYNELKMCFYLFQKEESSEEESVLFSPTKATPSVKSPTTNKTYKNL